MREALRTVWPYLWRYRRGMLLGFGALVMKVIFNASIPLLMRDGIDSLTNGVPLRTVFLLAVALAAVSALKGLFQYWMRVVLIGLSRDIEYDLRNDFFNHLMRLSWDFYARYRTGDIMARATNDLNAVRMMLGPGVMYWTETMFTFAFAIAVMASVDWRLTVMSLLPAPVITVVVVKFGTKIHDRFEAIQEMFSDISSRVQENVSGVRVIRAYVQEEAELKQFDRLNRDFIDQNIRLAKISGLFMPLLQGLIGLTFLIVLWAGGFRLLAGDITLGAFVMFNTYMGMLVWPMIALGWVVNLTQRGTASLSRINELMKEQPTIAAPAEPRTLGAKIRGDIEFRDAEMRYGARTALAGVTLRIRAGSTVAVVGHTGSGKSTLVHLIPRMMDVTAGVVLVDGIDVRCVRPEELRSHIGFVPQETFLFSATLGENIAFGVKGASPDKIGRAAEIAGLASDVESFPDGYQTMVGERGLTLSGGQKQRVAIARAILRNPDILILDDALSSVDTLTEERILTQLSEIMRNRTTILISHRVSTVRHADRIYVLENGCVAEEGTHAELVAAGGYYSELYQKQLLEEELEAI